MGTSQSLLMKFRRLTVDNRHPFPLSTEALLPKGGYGHTSTRIGAVTNAAYTATARQISELLPPRRLVRRALSRYQSARTVGCFPSQIPWPTAEIIMSMIIDGRRLPEALCNPYSARSDEVLEPPATMRRYQPKGRRMGAHDTLRENPKTKPSRQSEPPE